MRIIAEDQRTLSLFSPESWVYVERRVDMTTTSYSRLAGAIFALVSIANVQAVIAGAFLRWLTLLQAMVSARLSSSGRPSRCR